jgi:hypothetical protein
MKTHGIHDGRRINHNELLVRSHIVGNHKETLVRSHIVSNHNETLVRSLITGNHTRPSSAARPEGVPLGRGSTVRDARDERPRTEAPAATPQGSHLSPAGAALASERPVSSRTFALCTRSPNAHQISHQD